MDAHVTSHMNGLSVQNTHKPIFMCAPRASFNASVATHRYIRTRSALRHAHGPQGLPHFVLHAKNVQGTHALHSTALQPLVQAQQEKGTAPARDKRIRGRGHISR